MPATATSQSLWNRAGSFDPINYFEIAPEECLNPFGTGRGLSTASLGESEVLSMVSIPLEQGGVFRPVNVDCYFQLVFVSIPLEQGGVFRHGL